MHQACGTWYVLRGRAKTMMRARQPDLEDVSEEDLKLAAFFHVAPSTFVDDEPPARAQAT